MITKTTRHQHELTMVNLEDLVPDDHLLRKIETIIPMGFIYEYVESLYSAIGAPSIDPVRLFKMAFINRLFGINSMRRTVEEIKVNLAYRWYLGLNLDEAVPHFSDFSKNYTRKFSQPIQVRDAKTGAMVETTVFAAIFERILREAVKHGFLYPGHTYMDSTNIKANANKKKFTTEEIQTDLRNYQFELDAEIDVLCEAKDFTKPKPLEAEVKKRKINTVDPDSGYFCKGEHEKQFAYLAQTACDSNGFILAVKVNPANLHDSTTFSPVFQELVTKFGVGGDKGIRSIALDAGYKVPSIAREIIQAKITPLMPYTCPKGRKYNEDEARIVRKEFDYDKQHDVFYCPQHKTLVPRSIDRKNGAQIYRTKKEDCRDCPLRAKCLSKSVETKSLTRHIWQSYLDEVELIRKTEYHARYYAKRKYTIERVFADAKEKHGLRFTRLRGLKRVQDELLLTFACMNMKKIAMWASPMKAVSSFLNQLIHTMMPIKKMGYSF